MRFKMVHSKTELEFLNLVFSCTHPIPLSQTIGPTINNSKVFMIYDLFMSQITKTDQCVLVISPLIALMTDQVLYLRTHGITSCILSDSEARMSEEDRHGNYIVSKLTCSFHRDSSSWGKKNPILVG